MTKLLSDYLYGDVKDLVLQYAYQSMFADVLDELRFLVPTAPSGAYHYTATLHRHKQLGWRRDPLHDCWVGWDVWARHAPSAPSDYGPYVDYGLAGAYGLTLTDPP